MADFNIPCGTEVQGILIGYQGSDEMLNSNYLTIQNIHLVINSGSNGMSSFLLFTFFPFIALSYVTFCLTLSYIYSIFAFLI